MFFHNFKYTLRAICRSKGLVFWTLAFPIIMAIFFNMAFSGIEKNEKFDAIKVGVVTNDYYNEHSNLQDIMKSISDPESDNQVFDTKYILEDEAKDLLGKDEIDGYIIFMDDSQKVVITKNGVNQTIIKFVVEEIVQASDTAEIIQTKVQKIIDEREQNGWIKTLVDLFSVMNMGNSNVKDISDANLSYMTIEFYTLIAMTCLYGGILGAVAINWCLANMSNIGKRLSVTPVAKVKLVLSSSLAAYVVQLFGVAILLVFLGAILKINLGGDMGRIILLSFVGSLAGLTMGVAVTAGVKASENAKTGILIAITMLGCFFAGMQGVMMKYVIDKNVPIINQINPANMITDGFYALYYYDTPDKFYTNVISLVIFSVIMLALAVFSLRKQKYESL